MRKILPFAAVSALLLCGSSAFALESSLTASSALSPDALWKKIGDFCGIATWHPAIAGCKLTDGGKRRMLTLKDGGVIVEKLVKRDDAHRAYSYKIISSPLPVAAYQSTISVMDGKDGGSQLKWSGKYLAKGAASADAKKTIDGIYQAGADVLVKP
jgi:hypothetical protein